MLCGARRVLVSAVFLLMIADPRPLAAQCSTFFSLSYTRQPTSVALSWSAPAGVPPGTAYEVYKAVTSDYCPASYLPVLVTTTTNTSATVSFTPNVRFMVWVWVQSSHCPQSTVLDLDTFTTAPASPPTPAASVSGNNVTLTFPYSDAHTKWVRLSRAGSDSVFSYVTAVQPCGSDPKTLTDKNVPNGTWQYILSVGNAATYFGSGDLKSAPVSVTVLTAQSPVTASFSVSPLTIRAGQSATLSWVAQGATSVVIDQGIGAVGTSGSVAVSPSTTTTYTLTAMSGSVSATATATVTVITAPAIVVSSFPAPMLQQQGAAGGRATYTLTNAGGAASAITLSQNGSFFSQTPSSFTLAPGATQVVAVTASAQAAGAFEGASIPSGAGVASGLRIPIKLLSTALPSGSVGGRASANRVDVAAPAGVNPSGSVSFTNTGTATLTGVLSSDVPWLTPQSGVISISPGATVPVSFTIDRSQRPDADALIGSAAGNLSLAYFGGTSGKTAPLDTTPAPSVTTVAIVDSLQLTVSNAGPPALSAGEIALFVPGAGHITGTVGTFLSDISVLNPPGNPPINDVRFFFTPTAAGAAQKQATLPAVGGVSVTLADVVKNVFGGDAQVGSLQIRSASADKLSVSANIFNASKPEGTYGTTIPTFRSDHAVGAGDHLVLTGLRQDATGHTNLFIQETSGVGVTVGTEFLDTNGNSLGTRSDTVGAFALAQINNAVPAGAVAAIFTNTSTANGRFLAYATPVDQASGDNWSLVDWSRQYGYAGNAPVIIPVAGVLQGANNTFFRTDVAITNTASSAGSGTLRFYPRGGSPSDRTISLGARQTSIISNVVGLMFNAPSGSIGYLLFTPAAGSFVITSRTYTTVAGQVATFGTGVPTLAAAGALTSGSLRAIGSLEDAALATIIAARPATFRTNFGLLETSGSSVTVRVTLRFNYPAGTKVQAIGSASKDYTLNPNEFRQLNGMAAEILGASRDTLGDLHGVEADFQVVGGNGAVIVFTSSTDNGTGDAILRTE